MKKLITFVGIFVLIGLFTSTVKAEEMVVSGSGTIRLGVVKPQFDYRVVPAITGVESTFGKHIPYKSYNAYGWANGNYKFSSWEDSIKHVAMTLRNEYINKGATSIAKISQRYAPPSSTWAGKVSYFIHKIDSLPVTYDI